MKQLKNTKNHFITICIHKYWVFIYCCKAGIPLQGIIHDLSKFSPTEFMESVKYYTGTHSPIDECKKKNGVSEAWMHHKGRNPHHYEYWQDNFDKGGNPIQMPYKYAVEMLCDYLGAGRAYRKEKFTYLDEYEWWVNKSSNPIAMHPQTKRFISIMLYSLACAEIHKKERTTPGVNEILSKKNTKKVYKVASTQYNTGIV